MYQEIKPDNFAQYKVAGVVVLYNPGPATIDNINSYLHQVNCLYVIDNSESINVDLAKKIKSLKNVEYLSYHKNLGVASALNIAAKLAIEKGFDYLLTMDQDSKTPLGMVKALLNSVLPEEKIGIIAPLHSNRFNTHLKFPKGIQKVDVTMTSGNLLSLDAYKIIGGFCEDYFIDYVDIEYCFRMKKENYFIYQINDIVLEHNEADLSIKKFLQWVFYPHNHKPFRFYYKTRNLLFLRKTYKSTLPELLKIEYDAYFRIIIKIILFEKNKFLKLKMVLLGFVDYLQNQTGMKNFK